MTSDSWKARKVVIVGAGAVGSTFAYALAQGEYGVDDVCLSVPAVVSRSGVERIVEGKLSEIEHKSLTHSALVLKDTLAKLR